MGFIPELIKTVIEEGKPTVLAQIIHVEGSAYRKEGAWMFFFQDKTSIGLLSGGCLENDLHCRAETMFGTGKTAIYEYDLRAEDDIGWGRGIGCQGVITVMLRDVDRLLLRLLRFMHRQLEEGVPVRFIQSMKDHTSMICYSADKQYGTLKDAPIADGKIRPYERSAGKIHIKDESYYQQWIWPSPVLHLFGAGPDARPLVKMASEVGYKVHLYDWRPAYCTKEHFPTAASFSVYNMEHLMKETVFRQLDSVIIMTHDFQIDQMLLKHLRNFELLYVGLLGSKKRAEKLLLNEQFDQLRTPIGLPIGAEGAEEIAVSIIAEMIAVRRGAEIWPSLVSI